MISSERVLAAFSFERPDRIPGYDKFWRYSKEWEDRLGPAEMLSDISRIVPEEGAFYSRARPLKQEGDWLYDIDVWGRTIRRRVGAYFCETLEAPLGPGTDIDAVKFDSPDDDARYYGKRTRQDFDLAVRQLRRSHYVKTGGPYLRTTFVRGETDYLMDMAADPALARVRGCACRPSVRHIRV